MNLGELSDFIVKETIEADPRDKKELQKKQLAEIYPDSGIIFGNLETPVRTILVGIDIGVEELLLAKMLDVEKKIDLVLSHHSIGIAMANSRKAIDVQKFMLLNAGVKSGKIGEMIRAEKEKSQRRAMVSNCFRAESAARILGIPILCVHTPADNLAQSFVEARIAGCNSKNLGELRCVLEGIGEFAKAKLNGIGPAIFSGTEKNKCGKIFLDLTGMKPVSKGGIKMLASCGTKTIVAAHLEEESLEEAKKKKLNVLFSGHIASDSLGMNLLLDKIEKAGEITVTCCSGFERIKRGA